MSYLNNRDDVIIVTSPQQMDWLLRSDVVYQPIGMIDLSTVNPRVWSWGAFIQGIDYFISGFYSTADNHTMFETASATYAGNFRMQNCAMYSSGTSSKLFELDNQENWGAIEFNSCNIWDFAGATTEIGNLTEFRQFRTNDCWFFRVQDGLTFTGAWSGGFRINDTIVLSQAASSTLFKVWTGLTFAWRCISDINAASVDPTTITFDFVASNFLLDAGFQLTGASFAPNSSISVTTDETEVQSFFRDCVEIRNTAPWFEMEFTTQATTSLTEDTPVLASGTTTTTNATWWTQTANNSVTYNSSLVKDFKITCNVVVDGGANDEIAIYVRQWDNSASAYIDLKTKVRNISNVLGGLDVATYNMTTRGEFNENDRIEIWIENQDDGTDATVLEWSEIFVEVI